jgi:CDP-diacylglycerol--serine O-phosphatidyltransferase
MIIANVIHMIIVKKDAFSFLTTPIWKSQFGANKTLRGFFILPILNGALLVLVNVFLPIFEILQAFWIGAILGFVYMFFELPNSWIKRKMGVASGEKSKKNATVFMLMDKTDSSLGVSLACHFLLDWNWLETGIFFLIAVGTHVFFSWILVILKVKKRF